MQIRALTPFDVPRLADLLREYMRETYDADWHGNEDALRAAAFGDSFRVLLAVAPDEALSGFIAWEPAFDLHWCVAGAVVMDFYVRPQYRSGGSGLTLLASAARAVEKTGGVFLRGVTVENRAVRRLFARAGVCHATVECTLGGRAFRHLAGLSASSGREIARSWPEISWNFEA